MSAVRLGWLLPVALAACSNASGADDPSAPGSDASLGGTPQSGGAGGSTGGIEVPGGSGGGALPGGAGGEPVTGGAGGEPLPPWPDEQDTPWVPQPPAGLNANLPAVPGARPAECRGEWITAVRGWMAAPGGEPEVGAKGQLCVRITPGDILQCLRPGDTDAQGVFTVEIPENARCINRAAIRAIQPGVGRATTYCDLDIAGAGPVLVLDEPFVVFQTRRVTDLPPEGDVLQSRPIRFDDGLVIDFTPDLYYSGGGEYAELGGRRVDPNATGLCFLGEGPRPDGLYALYPEGTVEQPGFPVHFPNTTGLPAGTRVELFVLGGLECRKPDGELIPEASWHPFGTGTVSADGATINSDPGVGLPCLTWLGYRRLP